jgi:hypothetical protein
MGGFRICTLAHLLRGEIKDRQMIGWLTAQKSNDTTVGKEQRPTDEATKTPGTEHGKADKAEKEKSECEDGKWTSVAWRTRRTNVPEAQGTAKQNKGVFRDHYLETIQLTK